MALVGAEREALVSESDALTNKSKFSAFVSHNG